MTAPQRNTTRSDGKATKESSAERFRRHGALRTKAFPIFYPEDLLLAFEKGHPGEPAHEPFRYDMANNPENRRHICAIDAADGNLEQIPKVHVLCVNGVDRVVVSDGSRGCAMLRYLNTKRVELGLERYSTPVKFELTGATTESVFEHHIDGNMRADDGLMTRARKMAIWRYGDESMNIKPHALEEVGAKWGVGAEVVELSTDKRSGLITLSPRFAAALEAGQVSLMNARHIAELPALLGQADSYRHTVMDRFLDALVKCGGRPPRAVSLAMAKAAAEGKNAVSTVPKISRSTLGPRALQGAGLAIGKLASGGIPAAHKEKFRFAENVLRYMADPSKTQGLDPATRKALDEALQPKASA